MSIAAQQPSTRRSRPVSAKPTRRDLLKPVQLLGLAFGAAVFGGFVTLFSMGFFQALDAPEDYHRIAIVAAIVAGISFIAVLLIVSLLLLAIDPAEISRPLDRPVLYDDPDDSPAPDDPVGRAPKDG